MILIGGWFPRGRTVILPQGSPIEKFYFPWEFSKMDSGYDTHPKAEPMKAVIMAGGFGTRMRPLTINLPKPMIPMVNRPIMEIIVDLLKKHKITDITSVVFYQPEVITEYFQDGTRFDVQMGYKAAESDLGTAGSVKNCQAMIGKERL